jgi:hypothetical protein
VNNPSYGIWFAMGSTKKAIPPYIGQKWTN